MSQLQTIVRSVPQKSGVWLDAHLACGHVVAIQTPRKLPKRTRCWKCPEKSSISA